MDDLEYIKKFSKITIKGACERTNVDRSNLLQNKSVPEKAKIVREEIENQIAKLYIKEEENGK